MFGTLKFYLIIAAIIVMIVGGLSGALYFTIESNKSQAAAMATLKAEVATAQAKIVAIEHDAAMTKANQDALYSQLNDIRTNARKDQLKTVPRAVLNDPDSKRIERYINAETLKRLQAFGQVVQ